MGQVSCTELCRALNQFAIEVDRTAGGRCIIATIHCESTKWHLMPFRDMIRILLFLNFLKHCFYVRIFTRASKGKVFLNWIHTEEFIYKISTQHIDVREINHFSTVY